MKNVTNFITGTGRCGSTILSRMLMKHPDACILREFLASLDFRRMTHEEVSGDGLATILSGDLHPLILFLQRGGTMQEIIYKLSDQEKKQPYWSKPGLLLAPLPYLTDEAETLYDEVIDWAKKQPTAPLRVHYPKLFNLIAEKAGRPIPIEASAAGNIDLEIFPNSRILHIHRSGPETILSMCAHPWFRMAASFMVDPLSDEELKAAVECSEPEESDPILKRLKMKDEELLPKMTMMWLVRLAYNYRVFKHVPKENLMEVSFEELARDPRSHLIEIADFFELPDRGEAWLEEASKLLQPVKLRLPEADVKTQKYLRDKCFPLQILMDRVDLSLNADVLTHQMFNAHGREIRPLA